MAGGYPKLHHEDLDSYKVAIELLALAAGVVERYPRGYGPLAFGDGDGDGDGHGYGHPDGNGSRRWSAGRCGYGQG